MRSYVFYALLLSAFSNMIVSMHYVDVFPDTSYSATRDEFVRAKSFFRTHHYEEAAKSLEYAYRDVITGISSDACLWRAKIFYLASQLQCRGVSFVWLSDIDFLQEIKNMLPFLSQTYVDTAEYKFLAAECAFYNCLTFLQRPYNAVEGRELTDILNYNTFFGARRHYQELLLVDNNYSRFVERRLEQLNIAYASLYGASAIQRS